MPHKIITNIARNAYKDNMLDHIVGKLHNKFGLIPVIGAEIEFYYRNEKCYPREGVGQEIQELGPHLRWNDNNYTLKPEKGQGQFEIDIFPQENIHDTIEEITKAKAYLSSVPNITLHPKPYADDYGSAMHFHINFLNSNGENFFDHNSNIEHAAKSLCHFLGDHFLIFAPKSDHYNRFNKDFMAPTHVCFGGNNRSAAIRIPDAQPRRLEHRVSSPETNEYLAVCAILHAIYQGLSKPSSIGSHHKIHGNAFDEQYNLEKLPANIETAAKLFKFCTI